jgi:hypothetical protein
MHRISRPALVAALLLVAIVGIRPALAGAPLVCHPFDIGSARSLPIAQIGFGAPDRKYDVSHLVSDTIDLLAPRTPVIVRMETIRRATLYAQAYPAQAIALFDALHQRAGVNSPDGPNAVFDFGYLVETYRQAGVKVGNDVDGYVWIQKAIALTNDPQMEFAAAIITAWPKRSTHPDHVRKATAAAPTDQLLNRNLSDHVPQG